MGGRSGTVASPDGLLNETLGNPLDKGAAKRGPTPELLFAAELALVSRRRRRPSHELGSRFSKPPRGGVAAPQSLETEPILW
jgi:hypothetical protein